jgi:glutathione S-transferase
LVLNGDAIGESSEIIARLEERCPEPALYPEAEQAWVRALELEAYFDREIGPHLRRLIFYYLLPDRDLASGVFSQGFRGAARALYRGAFPALRPMFMRAMRVDEPGAELGWKQTADALDRIEAELQPSGYLVGTAFSVADLTAAALLFPLIRPPEAQCELPDRWPGEMEDLRSSVEDRDAFQWALGIWREHRGTSAAASG